VTAAATNAAHANSLAGPEYGSRPPRPTGEVGAAGVAGLGVTVVVTRQGRGVGQGGQQIPTVPGPIVSLLW
jgi:hypothetical protein